MQSYPAKRIPSPASSPCPSSTCHSSSPSLASHPMSLSCSAQSSPMFAAFLSQVHLSQADIPQPFGGVESERPLKVECQVRCRIPLDGGVVGGHGAGADSGVSKDSVCHLLLYTNNHSSLNHLAVVFGSSISSKTLEAAPRGDSTLTRLVRGATPLATIALLNPPSDIDNNPDLQSKPSPEPSLNAQVNPPLLRLHSACFTGETIGSGRCDCAEQLREAMRRMAAENNGVLVYLLQEGRGIGLFEKLKAYNLQDMGYDTVSANLILGHPPDRRDYNVAAHIIRDLGITEARLLTNNPDKVSAMQQAGIHIVERIPMVPHHWSQMDQGISMTNSQSSTLSPPAKDFLDEQSPSLRPSKLPPLALPAGLPMSPASLSSPPEDPIPSDDNDMTTTNSSSQSSTLRTSLHTKVKEVDSYILTKIKRMGHLIDVPHHLSGHFSS